jgi:hypothetical protein
MLFSHYWPLENFARLRKSTLTLAMCIASLGPSFLGLGVILLVQRTLDLVLHHSGTSKLYHLQLCRVRLSL